MSTSGLGKASYHHGDLRAALLAAAGALLDDNGPAGLTLRAAARRAGVSHGAPYRHFADRGALLVELAREDFARLAAALRAAAPRGGRAVAQAYLDFALTRPQRFRLMFSLAGGAAPQAPWAAATQDIERAFAAAFAELVDATEIECAARAAWALVHGLAQLMLDGHIRPPASDPSGVERFVSATLGALRFSVRARPSSPAA